MKLITKLTQGGILILLICNQVFSQNIKTDHFELQAKETEGIYSIECIQDGRVRLHSPLEGLWAISNIWSNQWPEQWIYASPTSIEQNGPWIILSGQLETSKGIWNIRDSYKSLGHSIQCIRRFEWNGKTNSDSTTLSVRWMIPGKEAQTYMPANVYYGNPSGARYNDDRVPRYLGKNGFNKVYFEEHRYTMPFVSVEVNESDTFYGAALHSLPSQAPYGKYKDQWWSLGVTKYDKATEIALLSGAISINDKNGHVKANQRKTLELSDQYLTVPPKGVIEKTFYIELIPEKKQGSTFIQPSETSIKLFNPSNCEDLPALESIVADKTSFALSRWHENTNGQGYRKYPHNNQYVMGWAGQSDAVAYALIQLNYNKNDAITKQSINALNFLTNSLFNENGFHVLFDPDKNEWKNQDHVSQGQAMESFARAILFGKKHDDIKTKLWEVFLQTACEFHANRILDKSWKPISTNEAFHISPLFKAYKIFGIEKFKKAALKATEYYGDRHLSMEEPYWGGTLDASCEDKEGAWAGFQGFLAAYELTREQKYLDYAEHAMWVALSYTVVWDIEMPASRMDNYGFKTRGWTAVSVQNQHLDVFGVLYTPEVYRMGEYLQNDDLKKLAALMYRSCGQLIDPWGSQGEQIQHTNFAQQGNLSDVTQMRGGYSEGWTVLWITAHFLNAATQFAEMGVEF